MTRFHGKVGLTECNDFLFRIAVHHDKIASVAGKAIIGNGFRSAFGHGYRFPDLGKMIGNFLLAYLASDLRGSNNLMEVLSFGILQNILQFTDKPILVSVFVGVFNIVKQFILL